MVSVVYSYLLIALQFLHFNFQATNIDNQIKEAALAMLTTLVALSVTMQPVLLLTSLTELTNVSEDAPP